ncbi:MAG: stage III sporulation AC/AD family protein [Oscillospiraceae bacterium]|jgi:stage III sporulation protein AD|nr:stage III sporulation AC/AD family protein [Oscillospiraceae bacterium]
MVWKLVAAAVAASVAALVVRQVKPEFALFVQLGGMVAVGLLLLTILRDLLATVDGLLQFAQGTGASFSLLAKGLGVCITTQLAADICRDSGSAALANLVELGGRLLVLSLALPLLKSVAELAVGLMRG